MTSKVLFSFTTQSFKKSLISLPTLNLFSHFLQSINGPEKLSKWPDAYQTLGLQIILESRDTILVLFVANYSDQRSLIFFLIHEPNGPKYLEFDKPPYISEFWKKYPVAFKWLTISSCEYFFFIFLPFFIIIILK